MITIVYSTHKNKEYNDKFNDHLILTSGIQSVQVLPYENYNQYSLSEIYNKGLNESKYDIVLFCHNDIVFETKNWGKKLLSIFEKNPEFGIIGLAGSPVMPSSGMWWEDMSKMVGIVNHEHEGKKWESKYSPSLGEKIEKTVIVDGLFIAINKTKIKETFDEEVKGFHMYDINFCFRNHLKDVNIGVTTLIRVTHKSIGQTNSQWEENRKMFAEKYKLHLPAKIKYTETDNLKVLVVTDDYNDDVKSTCLNLPKNYTKHLLVNKIVKNDSKELYKNGFTIFNEKSIPNTKIGDGRWTFKHNGQEINTVVGKLYNITNSTYDIIISEKTVLLDKLLQLYPSAINVPFNDCQKLSEKLNNNDKLTIHAHILAYNEEKILPFTLDHYSTICDKIYIYDNMSTDSSDKIYAKYPKVDVIKWSSNNEFHEMNNVNIKSNCYRRLSKNADWVIVCDCDEFIYHPNLIDKLKEYDKLGITLPKVEGHEMYSEDFPEYDGQLITEKIKNGSDVNKLMSKQIIFKPTVNLNYGPGAHNYICDNCVTNEKTELKLLHYKYLNFDYIINRYKELGDRLSEENKKRGWGYHYNSNTYAYEFNNELRANNKQII
jgi:hypothetical protein